MEGSGKLYYNIKEVAEMFGINASKLRYYEKEFPTLQPKKKASGNRGYTQADINLLTEILDLTDRQKFTLSGAREFLAERNNRRRANAKLVGKLMEIKQFLQQVRNGLDEDESATQQARPE